MTFTNSAPSQRIVSSILLLLLAYVNNASSKMIRGAEVDGDNRRNLECCTERLTTIDTVQADITSNNIVWFNNGNPLQGSTVYEVYYNGGCFRFGTHGHDWTIGNTAFTVVSDDGTAHNTKEFAAPGDFNFYNTFDDCNAGPRQFQPLTIVNGSGRGQRIGVRFFDSIYNDNVSGNPNPTFTLKKRTWD